MAGETASSRTVSSVAAEPEVPVVEALLAAHRLRRPVGVAVAQDYSSTSFKVPRPFVVLGWFWITAAWVSTFTAAPCPWNIVLMSFRSSLNRRVCWLGAYQRTRRSVGGSASTGAMKATPFPRRSCRGGHGCLISSERSSQQQSPRQRSQTVIGMASTQTPMWLSSTTHQFTARRLSVPATAVIRIRLGCSPRCQSA